MSFFFIRNGTSVLMAVFAEREQHADEVENGIHNTDNLLRK